VDYALNISMKISLGKVLIFVFYVLFFVIGNYFGYLRFQTNDEFGLIQILSGIYSGYPNDETWFISPILSKVLSKLFSFIDYIPWYGIAHLVTIFLSLFILIKFINLKLAVEKNIYLKILIYFPLLVFLLSMAFSLQFTQTAVIASGIGCLAYISAENIHGQQKTFFKFMCLLCFALGLSWRYESGLLAFFYISFSVILLNVISGKKKLNEIKIFSKKIMPLLFIIPIVLVANIQHDFSDSRIQQHQNSIFEQFNTARGNIHGWNYDFINSEIEKNLRKKVAWSPNDLKLFKSFFFMDDKVYSNETIVAYSNLYQEHIYFKGLFNFEKYLIAFFDQNKNLIFYFILYNYLLFMLFRSKPNTSKILFINLSTFVIFIFFVLLVSSIPERVVNSLIFLGLLVSLGIFTYGPDYPKLKYPVTYQTNLNLDVKLFVLLSFTFFIIINIPLLFTNNFFKILLFLNLIVLFIFMINPLWINKLILLLSYGAFIGIFAIGLISGISKSTHLKSYTCKTQGYDLILDYSFDKPILAFPSFTGALIECVSPLDNYVENKKFWNNLIQMGWSARSPLYSQKLLNMGLSPNIINELIDGKIYLAVANNLEIQMISQFAIEHRKIRIEWDPSPFVFSGNNLQVWKIKKSIPY
jgi:hypothetical protein